MDVLRLPFQNSCPVCGTSGNVWHREPEVFKCPKCASIYSEFGVVIESYHEDMNLWN